MSSNVFSFEQCTYKHDYDPTVSIKLYDFIWLQMFCQLTGGEFVVENPEQGGVYAVYKNGNQYLFVFPNGTVARNYTSRLLEKSFLQEKDAAYMVGFTKGYENLAMVTHWLKNKTHLPFQKLGVTDEVLMPIKAEEKIGVIKFTF